MQLQAAMSLESSVLDVRQIPPHDRHERIFGLFDALAPGDYFEFQNNHDPVPLRVQLMAQWPAQFAWDYIEAGPERWHVRITRKAAGKSCCGCCGG